MKRIWSFSKTTPGGQLVPVSRVRRSSAFPPDLDGTDTDDDGEPRYASRPVRPVAQTAARVGLWGAVGIGCIGGLVGLVRPSSDAPQPVADQRADPGSLPAPVAGVAEQAVEAWLTAGEDDQDRLAALFVNPPALADVDTEALTVERLTTVAGERLADGYWAVSVAVDVTEAVEPGASDGSLVEAASAEPETRTMTWIVEVGVVGDVAGGLAALQTPAVLPGAPPVEGIWSVAAGTPRRVEEDDPVAALVQAFLETMLTGNGDPTPYLAPGVEMAAANPAPFAAVELEETAVRELGDGSIRIWAQLHATTPGGFRQDVAYELVAQPRADRWEIQRLWGAPMVEPAPEPATGAGTTPAGD